MDIFELHYDLDLLRKCKITLGKAYAIDKSPEVSATYRRLDNLKREIEKVDYIKKVNKSYFNWAKID